LKRMCTWLGCQIIMGPESSDGALAGGRGQESKKKKPAANPNRRKTENSLRMRKNRQNNKREKDDSITGSSARNHEPGSGLSVQ